MKWQRFHQQKRIEMKTEQCESSRRSQTASPGKSKDILALKKIPQVQRNTGRIK